MLFSHFDFLNNLQKIIRRHLSTLKSISISSICSIKHVDIVKNTDIHVLTSIFTFRILVNAYCKPKLYETTISMIGVWKFVCAIQLVFTCCKTIVITAEIVNKICAGDINNMTCSPTKVIKQSRVDAGFAVSATACDGHVDCVTSLLSGAGESWNNNLAALVIQQCNNKQSCSFLVDSSWVGAGAECNKKGASIVYLEVEYTCEAPQTTTEVTITPTTMSTDQSATTDASSLSASYETMSTANIIDTSPTSSGVITKGPVKANEKNSKAIDWYVYVAAGVGGVILITVIIVVAVCLKRKRQPKGSGKPRDKERPGKAVYMVDVDSSIVSTNTSSADVISAEADTSATQYHYDSAINVNPEYINQNKPYVEEDHDEDSSPELSNDLSGLDAYAAVGNVGQDDYVNVDHVKNNRLKAPSVEYINENLTDKGKENQQGGDDVYAVVQKKHERSSTLSEDNIKMVEKGMYDTSNSNTE